jgi:hypothetical protein
MSTEGREPCLGAPLSEKEAERLVSAHKDGFRIPTASGGFRSHGVLQVESLVSAVLSETQTVAKIRTHDGIPQMADDLAECRIRYRPARTPVLAPTEFDAQAAISKSKARKPLRLIS